MVKKWSKNGQKMVKKWSKNGQMVKKCIFYRNYAIILDKFYLNNFIVKYIQII